jgi:hypothetical protein
MQLLKKVIIILILSLAMEVNLHLQIVHKDQEPFAIIMKMSMSNAQIEIF